MNDERPIEKLLRRHAKKRRDEAGEPPVLHPATRRLLQGEVARQFPKSGQEDKPSFLDLFASLTRRWIYAVGVFVVLAVTAAVLLPGFFESESNDTLALKTDSGQPRETEAIVAPPAAVATEPAPTLTIAQDRVNAPQPTPQPPVTESRQRDESLIASQPMVMYQTADRSDADALRKAEEAKRFEPTPSSRVATRSIQTAPPQSQPRPAGALTGGDSYATRTAEPANQLEAASRRAVAENGASRPSTAPVPVSLAPSRAAADKAIVARGGGVEKDAAQVYTQTFTNALAAAGSLADAPAKAKAVAAVLANFQIQQSGNELRVIDSDGSTYRGALGVAQSGYGVSAPATQSVASFERADLRRTQAAEANGNTSQQQQQDFYFRVEGTNRTLNQNVIFTWNFVDATNAIAASDTKAMGHVANQEAAKLPSQFPAMLQNSFINGRAQLGPTQQIEINAVPVKP